MICQVISGIYLNDYNFFSWYFFSPTEILRTCRDGICTFTFRIVISGRKGHCVYQPAYKRASLDKLGKGYCRKQGIHLI